MACRPTYFVVNSKKVKDQKITITFESQLIPGTTNLTNL